MTLPTYLLSMNICPLSLDIHGESYLLIKGHMPANDKKVEFRVFCVKVQYKNVRRGVHKVM